MAKAFRIVAEPILNARDLQQDLVPGPITYIVIADTMQSAIDKTEKVIESWHKAGHENRTIKTVKLLGEGANVIT